MAVEDPEVSARGKPVRILLVDDVPENLELLEVILSEDGYDILKSANGLEALAILKSEAVHLVVADAMMPKMDGFQLCKEVRAEPRLRDLPFILYTANYVDASSEELARSIGVDRYVVKDGRLEPMVDAVSDLLHQRYGATPVGRLEREPLDDHAFLQKHRAVISRKLEEQMSELQFYALDLERKNRELRASEERYRALFENARVSIFVIDRATGGVLDVNKQGVDLLGFSLAELSAMPSLPFADDGSFLRRILAAEDFVAGETTMRRQDGEHLDVDVGVGPLAGPQEDRILLYLRDISEQKKMREQLFQTEKMTFMGRLAAGIAHEVRNPLAAITLNLQYLGSKCAPETPMAESIRDALEGAKRLESVIENTLSLARVSPPALQEEDINALVTGLLGFIEISSRQKSVTVETELADRLPPVRADAKQIQQVVLNIVQNAIDASPSGGVVTLRTFTTDGTGPREPVRSVCMSVQDHGAGIPPEQRKYLFQQFRTSKPGGTGLGLVLSRQIMERHQGSIELQDGAGGGTLVRILLPVHR